MRGTQPPAPETAEKADALDTSEAEQAIADVQELAGRRLSPATFSPIDSPPSYDWLDPGDYVPRNLSGALADAEARLLDPQLSQVERAELTAAVEALQQRISAIEEQAGPGPAAPPPTVTDSGAASLEPPPAAQADVLGDAVARAIASIPGRGRRLATAAARPIDQGRSAPLQELAAQKATEVEQELREELTQIASAAGVAGEELTAKVAEQRAVVEEQAVANTDALTRAADDGAAARTVQGTAAASRISGAKQAVDREVAATEAAVAGPADTATIEAKRDELLGNLETAGAEVMAAYRSSLDGRTAELDDAARGQHSQIQSLADRQTAAIRRHHTGDPETGATASLETRNWAVGEQERVDVEVGRFTRAATAEHRDLVTTLNARLAGSRNRVRDWAAHQQGRERSWWERLIDSIRDWGSQATASSAQWERQRAADNRDAMAADLTALTALREAQVGRSQEELTAAMATLDEEQQGLALRYLRGDGVDSIGFVAESTMLRITQRRRGELTESLREEVLRDWDWEQLGILARATHPGFQPDAIAAQVRGSISGPGTSEDKLFAALGTARGPIERAAVEKCYVANYGVAMSEDVAGDVGRSELERAEALMAGGTAEVAVATIFDAMEGAGTDEGAIRNALRGRTPAELEEIKALYRERHGVELDTALEGDLSDEELDNARALAVGDTAAADAADLRAAMSGPGTDEEKIQQVYDTIRREVEADAQRRGLSTTEMNAEIRRRNEAVRAAYDGTTEGALAADLADDLSGGEHDLATALTGGDLSQIDAARAKVEDEAALYSSDDRIEDVVRNQHRRAQLEAGLDLGAQRARAEELLRSGDIGREEFQERLAQWEEDKAGLEAEVARRAQQNMADLRSAYGELAGVGGDYAFEYMVRMRTQGYSEDEILALMAGGGSLPPEEEIYYAVMGEGTDEDRIKQTLRGKTPEQIQEIRDAYETRFPGRSFDDDILGDLSGREDLDTELMLEMGDPSTFAAQLRAETDPAKRAALLASMETYLRRRKEFEETGGIGSFLLGSGADPMNTVAQMEEAMAAARALDAALAEAGGNPDDPAVIAAEHRMDMNFAGAVETQEQLRQQIDAYADIAVQVGVVIAGIAVTAATLGTAGPVIAAMYGAAASAAVGMSMNAQLRGLAYSWEEAGVDAAVGVMDTATAGLGARYLAPLARSSGMLQLVVGALGDGLEGVPSALLEAGLDDAIWASADPFGTLMATGGMALATGAALSAGIETAGGGYGMVTTPRPRAHGAGGAAPAAGGPDVSPAPVAGPAGGPAPAAGAAPELDVPPAADPATAAARAAAGEVPAGAPTHAAPAGPVPDAAPAGGPGRQPRTGDDGEVIDLDDPANAHLIEEVDGVDRHRPHVGDDGVIDLDDPRNRFLLEDRFAGMLPAEAALDPTASREFFEGFVRSQPEIEAALLRNSETGEHIVVQGSPGSVDIRPGHGVWEGLIPPDHLGTGRWDLVVHSHPVDASGTTPEHNFVPSGATGDFAWASYQAVASGQPVVQEIHVTTATGPDVSRYGYDPGHPEPYSIEFPTSDGGREVHRFDTIETYHDWYRDRFGGEMGPVPDGFAGRQREEPGTIGDDEPTQEIDISDMPTQIDIGGRPETGPDLPAAPAGPAPPAHAPGAPPSSTPPPGAGAALPEAAVTAMRARYTELLDPSTPDGAARLANLESIAARLETAGNATDAATAHNQLRELGRRLRSMFQAAHGTTYPEGFTVERITLDRFRTAFARRVPPGTVFEFDRGRVWRDPVTDEIVVQGTLGESLGAAGRQEMGSTRRFEEHMAEGHRARGSSADGPGDFVSEIAHASGPGVSFDAPYGLARAPKEFNQRVQNLGIESALREFWSDVRSQLTDAPDLLLTTRIGYHEQYGDYLGHITYRVEAVGSHGAAEILSVRLSLDYDARSITIEMDPLTSGGPYADVRAALESSRGRRALDHDYDLSDMGEWTIATRLPPPSGTVTHTDATPLSAADAAEAVRLAERVEAALESHHGSAAEAAYREQLEAIRARIDNGDPAVVDDLTELLDTVSSLG
ncbi:polymorphic toxin type 4 domain-containing protein [Georgenia sp. MJ173]|uniref:polymorphic toxin type 4 domain-containing protein n=1 Tax=Georgenia sunbinii TaxID=3117728 RepID=UPI002F26B910